MKQPMVKDYKLKDRLLGLEDIINYMLQNYDNQFEFAYALVSYATSILQDFYSKPNTNNPIYMPALAELITETLKIADYENGLVLMLEKIMRIIDVITDYIYQEFGENMYA